MANAIAGFSLALPLHLFFVVAVLKCVCVSVCVCVCRKISYFLFLSAAILRRFGPFGYCRRFTETAKDDSVDKEKKIGEKKASTGRRIVTNPKKKWKTRWKLGEKLGKSQVVARSKLV